MAGPYFKLTSWSYSISDDSRGPHFFYFVLQDRKTQPQTSTLTVEVAPVGWGLLKATWEDDSTDYRRAVNPGEVDMMFRELISTKLLDRQRSLMSGKQFIESMKSTGCAS